MGINAQLPEPPDMLKRITKRPEKRRRQRGVSLQWLGEPNALCSSPRNYYEGY
jgi:hypothetical protein